MKYFLRVLAQSRDPIDPEEVKQFIEDGFFFDHQPTITIDKQDTLIWNIAVVYEANKAPVIISTSSSDSSSQTRLKEIQFILGLSKASEKKDFISKWVSATTTVYVIEINQDQITDDCWEMLDTTEAFLMEKCNGILFTSDNEFYDHKLRKIYKL